MGAREKLNVGYFQGSAAIAAIVGAVAGSWSVFCITLLILFVGHIVAGDIRRNRK